MERFALDRAVQQLWEIHGKGALNFAIERANAAERIGAVGLADEWREIAQACRSIKGDPALVIDYAHLDMPWASAGKPTSRPPFMILSVQMDRQTSCQ